ncbi:hypothetical protein B9G55_03490 [Saccharibacillus sp. O16]|nr:hypothetical protein B9G55_03490 [Saccharibacillus sp. O16]
MNALANGEVWKKSLKRGKKNKQLQLLRTGENADRRHKKSTSPPGKGRLLVQTQEQLAKRD